MKFLFTFILMQILFISDTFADKFHSWPITYYVWNLGLAHCCDVIPEGDHFHADPTTYILPENLKEGDIIWNHPIYMTQFVRDILPKIKTHFILVLNDNDESFPGETLSQEDTEKLLTSEKLIHIFAQNCDYEGPHQSKFTRIPIGMDFHTVVLRPSYFCETYQSVEEQEATLNNTIESLFPTPKRIFGAFCDFQISGGTGAKYGDCRAKIAEKIAPLKDKYVWFLAEKIPRRELWKIKGKHVFSISPPGGGLDCHRTWEDLMLGCIVIVRTSTLDPLYKGLPVVIVNDWSEITPKNLKKWLHKYGDVLNNQKYRHRLTHEYWMKKILRKKQKFLRQAKY